MKRALAFLLVALASGALLAARPLARWDVVPYQRIDGVFKLGVVAFNESGVKVSFTVNGRKAWTAKRASRNDRTGVVEHVFPFDAVKHAEKHGDGPVTIGATATVDDEEPYALPDITLYVDTKKSQGSRDVSWVDPVNGIDFASGTRDAPVKTLKMGVKRAGDGGTVYLLPGKVDMKLVGGGKSRRYWTLVTPAPGVARSDVKVVGGRTGTDKLLFRGLDMTCSADAGEYRTLAIGEDGDTSVWFDDCRMSNENGRASGNTKPIDLSFNAYVTGGLTTEMTYGPHAKIVRNHRVERIAGEAFTGSDMLVVNSTVSDIDREGSELVDSALYQGFARPPEWTSDVILYNVRATDCKARGIVGRQLRDAAFVNVVFRGDTEGEAGTLVKTKFSLGLENVVFARVDIGEQIWEWMKQDSGHEDVIPVDVRLFAVKAGSFPGFPVTDGSQGILSKPDCDIICFPKQTGKEKKK